MAVLTVLEAYPSGVANALPRSPDYVVNMMLWAMKKDKEDALTCALIAYLYAVQRQLLAAPASDIPLSEGWVWIPRTCLNNRDRI